MASSVLSALDRKDEASGSSLSEREREIVGYLADGDSSSEIARKLGISKKTVESHRQHIREKLGVVSSAEIIKYAIRIGLTSL